MEEVSPCVRIPELLFILCNLHIRSFIFITLFLITRALSDLALGTGYLEGIHGVLLVELLVEFLKTDHPSIAPSRE